MTSREKFSLFRYPVKFDRNTGKIEQEFTMEDERMRDDETSVLGIVEGIVYAFNRLGYPEVPRYVTYHEADNMADDVDFKCSRESISIEFCLPKYLKKTTEEERDKLSNNGRPGVDYISDDWDYRLDIIERDDGGMVIGYSHRSGSEKDGNRRFDWDQLESQRPAYLEKQKFFKDNEEFVNYFYDLLSENVEFMRKNYSKE